MKKRLSRALALILSVMIVVSLTGCGSRQEERKLRISRTNGYTSATACVMQEKGFLEKHVPEDVKVEWSQFNTSADTRDALISGQLDIGTMAIITYITAYENGLPLTLLSYMGSSPINVYSNDPEITAMDEFPNTARIAILNKNSHIHMAFLAYCKETLGDAMIYDDLLTAIPAADAIASLETSKDFNGAVFSFPMLRKAEENKNLVLLADMSEVIQEYGVGAGFSANSEYYKNYPDIVEAFLEAQEEAEQFIKDNPEETAQILSELFSVDADEILEVLQKMPPHKEVIGYDKQARLMYEAGILEKEPTKFADLPNYDKIPK